MTQECAAIWNLSVQDLQQVSAATITRGLGVQVWYDKKDDACGYGLEQFTGATENQILSGSEPGEVSELFTYLHPPKSPANTLSADLGSWKDLGARPAARWNAVTGRAGVLTLLP